MEQQEYKQRRSRLLQQLGTQCVALIPAAMLQPRNHDCVHPFRQHSDFHYLTGFAEPDAVALLCPHGKQGEFILFNRSDDPELALWDGACAGQAGACRDYGADAAFSIADLEELLPELLQGYDTIYYPMGSMPWLDELLFGYVQDYRKKTRKGELFPQQFINLDRVLHEHRLIKTPAEQACLRHVTELSAQAHRRAMQVCRPGLFEYQIEAELLHAFQQAGCRFTAYNSIVAGGANACVLHYTDNTDVLRDGDLLLIDAGAEHECYAADITRTFPINGRFSSAQQAIYEIVLASQLAGLAEARPGNPWSNIQHAIVKVITQGLIDVGLLQGELTELVERKAYQRFYMHNSGHWLGLDVHDAGTYKVDNAWRQLVPGMVLTVEPGLYIAPHLTGIDAKWQGIGVRIEDDILITAQGHDVLTQSVPKTVADIEALMAGR